MWQIQNHIWPCNLGLEERNPCVMCRNTYLISPFPQHMFQATQYIGEICRYLLAQPHKPTDRGHRIRVAYGNGLRPQIWKQFMSRFNIERIGEFYGATEGNANISECWQCICSLCSTFAQTFTLSKDLYTQCQQVQLCIINCHLTTMCCFSQHRQHSRSSGLHHTASSFPLPCHLDQGGWGYRGTHQG